MQWMISLWYLLRFSAQRIPIFVEGCSLKGLQSWENSTPPNASCTLKLKATWECDMVHANTDCLRSITYGRDPLLTRFPVDTFKRFGGSCRASGEVFQPDFWRSVSTCRHLAACWGPRVWSNQSKKMMGDCLGSSGQSWTQFYSDSRAFKNLRASKKHLKQARHGTTIHQTKHIVHQRNIWWGSQEGPMWRLVKHLCPTQRTKYSNLYNLPWRLD